MTWTASLSAATFIVPDDEELIERAVTIIRGTIVDSTVQATSDGGIETVYKVAVDETLKGDAGGIVEIREWGGVLDGRWMATSGSPEYRVGQEYLLFLDRFRDGRLTTLELLLGRFELREQEEGTFFVRDLGESRILGPSGAATRPASEFLKRIRDQVARTSGRIAFRSTISLQANNLDTRSAASTGASQWSSGSSVNYTISSVPASGSTKGNDQEERILVDDPSNDIAGSFGGSGTIAIAFFGGTTGGFTDRINLTYSDIVVQDGVGTGSGVTQGEYATVLTHELGHTLGFRHSNQDRFSKPGSSCAAPLPCSSGAIMNSFVLGGLNGILQSWDKSAVQTNYGSAPNADYLIVDESSLRPWYRTNPNVVWRIYQGTTACNGPKITSGPVANPTAIQSGQSSQLSVSATASQGSLQFQWYRGASGNTSDPVPGGNVNSVSVSPGATTLYWVRITDGCGSTDSPAVQVTVAVCEPVITTLPESKAIGPGESTTLYVEAANATSYTWYVGARGNTSVLAGSGPSLTVTPSQTTSYWVRVANACGSVDSASVTVQVLACPPPVITQQPKDVDIEPGAKATLQVVAVGNGSLRYEWFRGARGDTSQRLSEENNVLVLENVAGDFSVWVRVHDACGFRDSRTAQIRVVTVCRPAQINVEPVDVTVPRGGSATMQVEAAGTSLVYRWERRSGTHTEEVGLGPALTTGPVEEDRVYFVRVQNTSIPVPCGNNVKSRDVRVMVTDCWVPRIVQQTNSSKLMLGDRADLQVSIDGDGPFDYQWYEGVSGNISRPLTQGTSATLPVGPLAGSVSYWVRVTGECGTVDSETITLTVESKRGRPTTRP